MDIFGDDIDSFYNTDDALNENVREGDIEEAEEDNDADDENGGESKKDSHGEPIKVEPKKRSVRNPRMRLNVERLKSDRGIHTLENYFKDIKYRGKGYERQDLSEIMKRLEHWAHRLYPSYRFDDFVDQVEKLGKKKEMQTHMYRYRHGLLEDTSNKKEKKTDGSDEEGAKNMEGVEPIDELDEIIDQQIENYTMLSKAPATPAHDRTFDSIRSSIVATPRLREQHPIEASTPIIRPAQPSGSGTVVQATLTSDQMARIAENRRLAQERLRKKKEEAAAAAAAAIASTSTAFASTSLHDKPMD